MNNQKGFADIILIIVAVMILISAGTILVINKSNLDLFFLNNQTPKDSPATTYNPTDDCVRCEDKCVFKPEGSAIRCPYSEEKFDCEIKNEECVKVYLETTNCGDGICEGEESMEVCPQCDPIEGSNSCPTICHLRCPEDCVEDVAGQTCGNGICDDNEYGPQVISNGVVPDNSGKVYCPKDCPASI